MAVQDGYEWITYSGARVLRQLAQFKTEREAADSLDMTYNSVRSIVEAIKEHTGIESVREIGRWWQVEAPKWARWALEQGGVKPETAGRERRRVRKVPD